MNDAITVVASFVIIKEVIKSVKNMKKVEFENSNQHGKKNFPGLKLTRRRIKCFALCAAGKVSWLYVGINGSSATYFRRDSLVSHEKSHSHYFCFQRAKSEEKPEQVPLKRISLKIDEESKESS